MAHAAIGADWTKATDIAPWSARQEAAAAAFDGKLWVLGGNSSGTLHDVWYSSDGVAWTEATSSAEWDPRSQFGTAVFGGKLWVMGGGGANNLNDVWYSSDGVTWTEATSSAEWGARRQFGTAVFDGKLWVMGGVDLSGDKLNDVWYSSDGVTWTEATSSAAWSARYAFGADVLDDKLWVMGGVDSASDLLNDVWYSSDGVAWTEATSSAAWVGRVFLTSAALDDKLWIIGGSGHRDAWYSALTYALSFDSQGGLATAPLTDEPGGASVTLPAAPSRSGYDFQQWNTSADGSGTSYAAGASYTMPAADTTLYAVWEEIPEEHHSSHSSGGSVQSQVKNLNAMGNTTAAESLKAQWPQLFSATSSDSGAVLSTAGSVRDLELGMTGDDVLALQKLLNANGFAVAANGPGAPGSETAYFGALTKAALAAYQKAHGIAPAAGYFGPITRTQMKSAGLTGLWWQ